MAVSLIGIGASLLSSSVTAGAIGAGFSVATSYIAGGLVGTIVAGGLSGLVTNNEQDQVDQLTQQQASALVNKASNNAPLPVIYGFRKVGGTRVFMETSGTDNEFLHVVIAMSEGEINSFDNVYLNNIISSDSRFNGVLNVYTHTGADNQTADSNLVSALPNWTSAHRLRGTAYVYVKLKFDQDAYAQGLPTITADIKGTKVFDPRNNSTAWSDNPVLAIRDYLTNTRYGRGIATSLIDDTSFIASANYCDATVSIGGATVKRYTTNGIVNTSQGSMSILKQLLTACKGFLIFSGGKYKIIIDKPETAGFTFDEDNIIGQWTVSLGSKNNQFNRIRTNFINYNKEWQPDIAIIESSALRTLDNGILLEKSISLPYTTDIDRAKMITTINLNQSRQKISCEFTATIAGLKAEVGDVVYIKHSTVGWQFLNSSLGKKFRIIKISLQNNDEVRVQAIEYSDASYNFGTIQIADTAPNTNLPDVTTTKIPVNLLVSEELFVTNTGQGVQVRANLNWTAPTDAFVQYYEVEFKEGAGAFQFVTQTRSTSAEVNNLKAGSFTFRVRSVNTIGVRSAFITVTDTLAGLTTPPLQIANFSVNAIDGSAYLQWDRSTDIDVIHGGFLRIRHTPLITGAVWAGGSALGQALAGTSTNASLPLLAGTYMIKAVDSAGNFANNATLAVTTVPNIIDFNVVQTITESPAFSGAKVNTVKSGNTLVLTNTNNVVATSGSYTFNTLADLGAVFTSRITANFSASGFVQTDLIDGRTALIDTWANFDGEPSDKVIATLQIRTTQTDPASNPTWTPYQPLVVGDFQARGFQFRVVITSSDSSRNIAISALGVVIDMPDRNEKANNITVPSSGLSVSYANPFKTVPYLGITGQNLSQSDYWVVSNETVSGFSILIYNSGGTAIQKNINYMATGFGRRA